MYTEEEVISGLENSDTRVMKFVYDEYFPVVRAYVVKNGGSVADATDVFQDGMMVVYSRSRDKSFDWTSKVQTYLFSVCRNKWLMELRSRRRKGVEAGVVLENELADQNIQQDLLKNERYALMRRHFDGLGGDCREILQQFFDGVSLGQIAENMGFSASYAKKKKFVCQKRLIESIVDDPEFEELKFYD